jgi:hypothetical protein
MGVSSSGERGGLHQCFCPAQEMPDPIPKKLVGERFGFF